MSAAHCQGNVREFPSVWRVVTLKVVDGECRCSCKQSQAALRIGLWCQLCCNLVINRLFELF